MVDRCYGPIDNAPSHRRSGDIIRYMENVPRGAWSARGGQLRMEVVIVVLTCRAARRLLVEAVTTAEVGCAASRFPAAPPDGSACVGDVCGRSCGNSCGSNAQVRSRVLLRCSTGHLSASCSATLSLRPAPSSPQLLSPLSQRGGHMRPTMQTQTRTLHRRVGGLASWLAPFLMRRDVDL
ncbi:hypothetical protein OH77DRAFT_646585 [Trametes cingulata]|nr:hypothetical protein OH77DRAFT_646585 [Trametes cingulata]